MPIFDTDHFSSVTQGDTAFQKELIGNFLEGATQSVKLLQQYNLGEPEWTKAAHKLKGSALTLGLARLGDVSNAAEVGQDIEQRNVQLAVIEHELREAEIALDKFKSANI